MWRRLRVKTPNLGARCLMRSSNPSDELDGLDFGADDERDDEPGDPSDIPF